MQNEILSCHLMVSRATICSGEHFKATHFKVCRKKVRRTICGPVMVGGKCEREIMQNIHHSKQGNWVKRSQQKRKRAS